MIRKIFLCITFSKLHSNFTDLWEENMVILFIQKIQLWWFDFCLLFFQIFFCYILRIPISFRVSFASKSLLSITKQWITVSLFITFLIKFHHIFIVLSICDFTAFFSAVFSSFTIRKNYHFSVRKFLPKLLLISHKYLIQTACSQLTIQRFALFDWIKI